MEDTLYLNLYERFKQSKGVSTDTRTIKTGQIFFALKGPNFNANDFAVQAIEKGAVLSVVDSHDHRFANDERFFVVEDCLVTLQWLATRYRKDLKMPVLGLTGSNGKTTTKELIHAVLSIKKNAFATPGKLNNHKQKLCSFFASRNSIFRFLLNILLVVLHQHMQQGLQRFVNSS